MAALGMCYSVLPFHPGGGSKKAPQEATAFIVYTQHPELGEINFCPFQATQTHIFSQSVIK